MDQVYSSSDLCLVPQAMKTGSEAFPSKVYRIMACGRPVLAITENDSDFSRLIIEASCGIRSDPGCSDDLAMFNNTSI